MIGCNKNKEFYDFPKLYGPCPDVPEFIDPRDGNSYKTILIENQCWMAENLAYLPTINSHSEFESEGSAGRAAYSVRDIPLQSVEQAKQTMEYQYHGVNYNWYAAITACPEGWVLPSDEDWKKLETNLGMSLEEIHQEGWRNSGNLGDKLKHDAFWDGLNSSGFNALPASYVFYIESLERLSTIGNQKPWWSSTDIEDEAIGRALSQNESGIVRRYYKKTFGLRIRCLKKTPSN